MVSVKGSGNAGETVKGSEDAGETVEDLMNELDALWCVCCVFEYVRVREAQLLFFEMRAGIEDTYTRIVIEWMECVAMI